MRRRLVTALAVVALAAACGATTELSAKIALRNAARHTAALDAATVTLSLAGDADALADLAGIERGEAEAAFGTSITFTSSQHADGAGGAAAVSVDVDGDAVAELRLIDGILYVRTDAAAMSDAWDAAGDLAEDLSGDLDITLDGRWYSYDASAELAAGAEAADEAGFGDLDALVEAVEPHLSYDGIDHNGGDGRYTVAVDLDGAVPALAELLLGDIGFAGAMPAELGTIRFDVWVADGLLQRVELDLAQLPHLDLADGDLVVRVDIAPAPSGPVAPEGASPLDLDRSVLDNLGARRP